MCHLAGRVSARPCAPSPATACAACLLILGVAIGVTTLLAIFTIVSGLSGRIRDDVVSASQPYIYIARIQRVGRRDPDEMMRRPQLMPELPEALEETEGVGLIDYEIGNNSGMVLNYEQEKTNFVQAFGCSENFPFMFSLTVDEGRFFTAAEVTARERVAVLGYGPRKDLFPRPRSRGQDPAHLRPALPHRRHHGRAQAHHRRPGRQLRLRALDHLREGRSAHRFRGPQHRRAGRRRVRDRRSDLQHHRHHAAGADACARARRTISTSWPPTPTAS